ncbi:cysteine desulfurase [Brevibacterium sp. 50QC2O2]|uniref:cysteine desulfurase family protein n=1 Tax=unclassified Brevibacterium TaxID=2614124 RepID=UPI00211C7A20|nr:MULTISPECIES: cysteine desulfurase family protein [unclassified Brevibacterium]MCQ9367572.1 cysteine desulfurase [Brevibacterium sp. 91QC2O2]MCQ9389068.1 cysteine desulfurase [Brevibacterium sp. 50QC2O2]
MRAYFDHAATHPIQPEVLAAYTRELERIGNPSALHTDGQAARLAMEDARRTLAGLLHCDPSEVIFTSGGTEADNQALKGLWWSRNDGARHTPVPGRPGTFTVELPRPRLLVSTIEHHAVIETAQWLETQGAEVVWLSVDAAGRLDLDAYAAALDEAPERTALVSVMLANNEVGTIQPIARIAQLAHAHGIPVHTDAVQAFGQIPVDFAELGVDALSISGHKIGAPVGVGALILGRNLKPVPVLHGGGQERQIRSGTLNVPSAVAFATAARLALADVDERAGHLSGLRDRLIAGVEAAVPTAHLSGARGAQRLPGNVHFVFDGCEGDSLLFLLDFAGFDTSTGSACQAGVNRPSHVLMMMGRDEDAARSTQRFSLGMETTVADVDRLIEVLPQVVAQAGKAGMVSATPAWMRDALN